jgi:hypothetical protein
MTKLRGRTAFTIAAFTVVLTACSTAATPSPNASEAEPTAAPPTATSTQAAEQAPEATATPDTSVADAWRANATRYRGMDGQQFDYDCPAGGEADTIWGTDTYTDDSSVCTAGVHVGVIALDEGGTVTIEIRPGEDEYQDTERNGIASQPYPAWGGSFVVIDD